MQRLTLLVVLISLMFACVVAGQTATLQDASNARTAREHSVLYTKLLLDEELEASRSLGYKDPAWDELFEDAMQIASSRAVYNKFGLSPDRKHLRDAVQAALDAGCDAPGLLAAAYRAFPDRTPEERLRRRQLIDKAATAIEGEPYPPLLRFQLVELQADDYSSDRPQIANALYGKAMRALEIDAKAGRIQTDTPTSQRRLYNFAKDRIFHRAGKRFSNSVYNSLSSMKELDDWSRHMLEGLHAVDLAWRSRGRKFAEQTEDEQLLAFARHLRTARTHFITAHRLHPNRPEAATALIEIDMGMPEANVKDFHYWFEQALKAEIDWEPAYWHYVWALHPRWHGTHQMMLEVADATWKAQRFDTFLPILRISIISRIGRDIQDREKVWGIPELYDAGAETVQVLLTRPEWKLRKHYLHTIMAGIAYWGADDEDFSSAWRQITDGDGHTFLDADALWMLGVNDSQLREHAAGLGLVPVEP